jgi:hypothetical protein
MPLSLSEAGLRLIEKGYEVERKKEREIEKERKKERKKEK